MHCQECSHQYHNAYTTEAPFRGLSNRMGIRCIVARDVCLGTSQESTADREFVLLTVGKILQGNSDTPSRLCLPLSGIGQHHTVGKRHRIYPPHKLSKLKRLRAALYSRLDNSDN
jgi:hypothetical protein